MVHFFKTSKRQTRQKGVTLLELIIVLVIASLSAGMFLPRWQIYHENRSAVAALDSLRLIMHATRVYLLQFNVPATPVSQDNLITALTAGGYLNLSDLANDWAYTTADGMTAAASVQKSYLYAAGSQNDRLCAKKKNSSYTICLHRFSVPDGATLVSPSLTQDGRVIESRLGDFSDIDVPGNFLVKDTEGKTTENLYT